VVSASTRVSVLYTLQFTLSVVYRCGHVIGGGLLRLCSDPFSTR